jgi:hypothetical protein
MAENELIEEKSIQKEILEEKEKQNIRLIKGNNINLILFTIFVSIIIILSINFIFQNSSSSKSNLSNSEKERIPKKLDETLITPYETPYKLESMLDYLLYPYHSDIIKNLDDYEFIRDALGKISLKMTFNSNYHGDYALDVHSRSNYHHTLVLIETENGNRFGGYTSDNFTPGTFGLTSTSIEVSKKDTAAFLFNLDLKKIYNVKKEYVTFALDSDDFFTLCFGDGDLLLRDQFLTKGGTSNFPAYYGDENSKESELTNGEEEFEIKYFEMYNVLFFSEFGDENNRMGVFKNFVK